MFVNGDEDLAFVCKLLLESRGHVVEAVTSGEEALADVRRFAPQLLIVDDTLGDGISGVELVRALRQRFALTLPIVMLAAQREAELRGFEAGIDAFVAKPFISTDLMAAVERLLAGEARHIA